MTRPAFVLRKPIRIELTDASLSGLGQAILEAGPFDRIVLAEGDSWFDIFTPFGRGQPNLLDALRLPGHSAIVDLSRIGDTAAAMADGWQAAATADLLDDMVFDALLLSAGGNDLKTIFAERVAREVIATRSHGLAAPALKSRAMRALSDDEPIERVVAAIGRLIDLRDGSERNRDTPVVLHGYDVFQPRPAPPRVLGRLGGREAWIHPILVRVGMDPREMLSEVDRVLRAFDERLQALAATRRNVHLVRQIGTLEPAPPDSTGPSEDWQDEIHPTKAGFAKLGAKWNAVLGALLEQDG